MIQSVGYGAKAAQAKLERIEFERDDPKPNEVVIEVLYTGVCHSDIQQVKNEWKNTVYPASRATRSSAASNPWVPRPAASRKATWSVWAA